MGEAKRRAAEIAKLKEQTQRRKELSAAAAFATLASFAGRTANESPSIVTLQDKLRAYERNLTATSVAALLTVPALQANCYRLELLQQLVLSKCSGTLIPTASDIVGWINTDLGDVAYMEDPPEDVFVMEVISKTGGFKVLGGLWEVPDAATNLLIESIEALGGPPQLKWLQPAYQLLRISDVSLSRSGLQRWDIELSAAKAKISDVSDSDLACWRSRVIFTPEDLDKEGIDPKRLESFMLNDHDIHSSQDPEVWSETSFGKPLLKCGETVVLAFPTSVTYAIRKAVVEMAAASGQLSGLNGAVTKTVVHEAERMFRASSRHAVTALPLPAHIRVNRGPFRSLVFRVGSRRVVHVVVLEDPLKQFAVACLSDPSHLSGPEEAQLHRHVSAVRAYVESLGNLDTGYTIVLSGHLGQGSALSAPKSRAKWVYESTRLGFLEFILQASHAPLDKLLLLLTQRSDLESAGVHLPNYNGLLNLYAYWLDNGHTLRIPAMAHDQAGFVQIATDYVLGYRLERRQALDIHCEPTSAGKTAIVIRANSDSIYESVKAVHAYLDISNLTNTRESFCVHGRGTAVWITLLTKTSDPHHQKMMHELWEGLQLLLDRTLAQHVPVLTFGLPAVEILLDFRSVLPTEQALEQSFTSELQVTINTTVTASIRGSKGFLAASGSKNTGELLLLSRVIEALRLLSNDAEPYLDSPDESALKILGGSDAKILHAFTAVGAVRYLLSTDPRPTYRLPEEYRDAAIRAAFAWLPAMDEKVVLDQDESCQTLNSAVSHLLEEIARKLRRFNRRSLIVDLLHSHETLIRDQHRWAMTARAVMALHGEEEGTAAALQQDQERSQAKLTLRALVEASVCECSVSGGISPDGHAIDELFGLMWALIQLGRDSEAIYHHLSSTGITIHPSGAYSFTADLLAELGGPYTIDSFRTNYEAAAEDYDQWVRPPASEEASDVATDRYESSEFTEAFRAEYSLSYDVFIDICSVLLDAALEAKTVVADLLRSDLIELCKNRGITEVDLDHFIDSFVLSSRPTWAPQTPLAKPRDVQPWRFERRLSVMLRPLIQCASGKEIRYVFGVATFQQSISYVLDCTERGKFDKDVFRSSQMRSYIGRRVDALGADFTKRVATTLQEIGWKTETEVKMSALGAGKNPNLGDIDVLAWNDDGRILVIECKRLKTARTIAEIALTCDRFRGNTGDHLFKHLRRFRWLRDNTDKLANFVGLDVGTVKLRTPLVTSAHVPFRYLKGLDIAPEDIWSFGQLLKHCPLAPTRS